MNHAFILQIHKEPELFGRIVHRLAAPNHYFFVNVDKKVDDKPFKEVCNDVKNVCFLEGEERKEVNWGGFSQIDCTLQLLRKCTAPQSIDYIHSISGQDYPTVGNDAFDKFFEKHNGQSFMLYDKPEEHEEWSKPRGKYEQRYMPYHLNDIHINRMVKRLIEMAIHLVEHIHYLRPAIDNVYAGWSWFSWHRSVAEFVLIYLNEHPAYLKRFHNTACCDELIFHTLLHQYLKRLNINPNNALRYIDWHPSRPYEGRLPLTLDERDYELIINSGALFCRKVDEQNSGKLLDMLDGKI